MAINFYDLKLVKGGSIDGDSLASGTIADTTLTYYSFGGDGEMWGLELTPSDINSSDFGCVVSFQNQYITNYLKSVDFGFSIPLDATITGIKVEIKTCYDGAEEYVRVDHVRITIYYTESISSNTSACPYVF